MLKKIDPLQRLRDIQEGKNLQKFKICPFMSTSSEKVPCSSECALFKKSVKEGYNCPITELSANAWYLKLIHGLLGGVGVSRRSR